jgi:hypothetical protein
MLGAVTSHWVLSWTLVATRSTSWAGHICLSLHKHARSAFLSGSAQWKPPSQAKLVVTTVQQVKARNLTRAAGKSHVMSTGGMETTGVVLKGPEPCLREQGSRTTEQDGALHQPNTHPDGALPRSCDSHRNCNYQA